MAEDVKNVKYQDDHFDHLKSDIENSGHDNKVELICNICSKPYLVSYTYWKQNRNKKDRVWRCQECNKKYKSELNKSRWANYTKEELDKISKKQSETQSAYWARLTDDEIYTRLETFIKAGNEWYKNLSQEEKNKRSQQRKDWWNSLTKEQQYDLTRGIRDYYSALSDEEREKYKEVRLKWRENLPPEIIDKLNADLKENNKKWLERLSPEEKEAYYKKNGSYLQKFWNNVTDEQLLDWFYKTNQGVINSSIVQNNKTATELEFINYLNIYKIDYIFQYVNDTYPSEFYEIFDKRKGPYHKWDFKLNLRTKSILVDIDGSEHAIPIGKCFTGDGIDIGLTISENDSKRPYLRDGLDAYIVQCYDDKITNETAVLSLISNKSMTFKDFISYINGLNIPDKELKMLIKEEL